MKDGEGPRSDKLTLVQLIPNMLTLAAIGLGLSSLRYGLDGRWELAVQMILLAAVLDGLDGRIARALGSDSPMGAELDSLADFLNFGVAPGFLLYLWALEDLPGFGWLAVLVYAICCVLRLARFNVARKEEVGGKGGEDAYFIGVPSPAGAMLAMLPMFVAFAFGLGPVLPDPVLALYVMGIGFLMVSPVPTWSFKTTKVPRRNVKVFLVGFVVVGALLALYAWISLVAVCVAYVAVVLAKLVTLRRRAPRG
ncbi:MULTISPECIES: CDP-diacylglycerol--serine O-phosphatidyltransferase [unclassified Roseivivax]|uniref:CDP-diacylglycerol--serine O-phosphatidyltransferase n=1 Tax=Roseivivax sp. GX 12232 TaxID=2900547 RepID=UPI001E3B96D0|nr:CDP-diacylglycerol--serine O-phosphatidyltransferase [Roseivivax sp. GX 12232]MCE0505777.1 CDP-diacylglycerol--serine O-phosphatidyltransferase [Roseivivax sp. GX 12232]